MNYETRARNIDEMAIVAATDEVVLEQLISKQKAYILSCAGATLSRHIYWDSEEAMLAIEAFVEAVKDYSYEKGSFLSFSKLVIKRRLIDNIRKEKSISHIIPMDPSELLIVKEESDSENSSVHSDSNEDISFEIQSLSLDLKKYGISFFDLADSSPRASKTKDSCRSAISYIIDTDIVFCEMKASGLLPIKVIEKNTGVPRKILERHRKYIITVTEILKGDYRCLAPYVSSMKRRCDI